MKILVALKRTIDYQVRVRLNTDQSAVITDGVKMSINPFDEIALEEAIRLREKTIANEVIVCTIGPSGVETQLRTALAMGADRAIWIERAEESQPLEVASALLKIIEREQPGLVILGKQAIDGDNNQTGQMLAALWDRPQATFISQLTINGTKVQATREIDTGLETIEIELPAVITTDLRLNEPRYVKMPDIMKAKNKPLQKMAWADLKLENLPRLNQTALATPAPRKGGAKVESVEALLTALEQRGAL